ncbi:Rho GTPase-activating protein domain protein [Metarhizium guizhouense ARSEF 977]|uniref:Rho GTPase-activating protein domain protein n=1 Tax=Metarhizium guizhouense (strain ARSEF 977) TaxID=1276136 RepID=A0A0B4IC55_METGA|nr:Rho GTPase-activating protein domain protein [Metarhizium guizhouense ARSEF 977]
MTAIVDEYIESPLDNDDVFPCKGCGEILEEGKAFELAGNRWHLDCFRCHTCGTLLDSDANLLLLGDGSLICNNCTYSCSACGNKIEDLAILTGDQAFCATCFRCRNCKRKIENLRYARTSQGIFCMGCHETLMARRRKKSKAASAAKSRDKENSPMITEKSLPALPPSAIPPNAFSNDRVDPDSDTPTELSPRPRGTHRHNESSSRGSSRPSRSPERSETTSKPEGLGLPATTYRKNRNSTIYQSPNSGPEEGPESFFIPVALDPSPALTGTPRSASDNAAENGRRKDRDYFGVSKGSGSDKRDDSQSSTPHIAFQEKGRQPSSDLDVARLKSGKFTKNSEQGQRKASVSGDEFKLQDAPVKKRGVSTRSNSSHSSAPQEGSSGKTSNGVVRKDGHSNLSEARKVNEPRTSEDTDGAKSGSRSESSKAITRKELPASASMNSIGQRSSRSGQSEQNNLSDSYTQPRTAPPPPPTEQAQTPRKSSGSSKDPSEPKNSPKLPRWSNGGDFSMDEDMARILGTDEGSSSILRRVSNVVRHGRTGSVEAGHPNYGRINHSRSISETTRATVSPRWPKTPLGDDHPGMPHDISSPISLTPPDDAVMLKRQLRNSEQRVAELERQFNTEKDLKSLNKKLVEKRKTVSVLDTQTEIMIRQLEVLAGYVERAKETKTPIDPRELEDSAIKDFVKKLDAVKETMSEAIEKLHEERDQLVEEKNQAIADRDRALMEFEQLSSKNAQLADMNNDLTHQIQERFKSQIGDLKSPNGLGIYGPTKSGGASSINLDTSSLNMGTTLVGDEEPIVESGPTVVQVRKGQVKKFNWKKGSKTMAQNVAKGVNRAVVAFQQNDRERMQHQGLVGDNIGLPYNMTVTQVESAAPSGLNGQNRQQQHMDPGRQGFGFFGKKNAMPKSASSNTVTLAAAAEPASILFGSDLVERTEYERRQIPAVVTRCIEEVELRGMDQEGIYRKTGGNSQVNMIKDGFDKNENFDISDPDLDITAVTSVLKQYFRKLPTPLLTFDVYERVLESNAIADETERCSHLRKTFASMPESHGDCLEFLMFHLNRVASREPENLMSPKNLAVVFAPTIMRDLSIEREMTDMHAKNIAVQFVIENTNRIFDDS